MNDEIKTEAEKAAEYDKGVMIARKVRVVTNAMEKVWEEVVRKSEERQMEVPNVDHVRVITLLIAVVGAETFYDTIAKDVQ